MVEHAAEIIQILMGLLAFFAVYTLNGIKSEIRDVKDTVRSLEADLRGTHNDLDRRVARVEARCGANHHTQD